MVATNRLGRANYLIYFFLFYLFVLLLQSIQWSVEGAKTIVCRNSIMTWFGKGIYGDAVYLSLALTLCPMGRLAVSHLTFFHAAYSMLP